MRLERLLDAAREQFLDFHYYVIIQLLIGFLLDAGSLFTNLDEISVIFP